MSMTRDNQPRARGALFGLLAVGLVIAASGLGQLATFPSLEPWCASLHKPWFNPPNAVFAPVWTALYALMAFAFWRVLRLPPRTPGRGAAIAAFLGQLALNVAWSFLFFAAQNPALGLIDVVPQCALIVLTIAFFWPLDRLAALCLVPLALWVGFAALLNVAIWRMN
jgi:tryptophan-rich sensory protein